MQFNPLTSNLNFQHHYSSLMCCHAAQETFIIIFFMIIYLLQSLTWSTSATTYNYVQDQGLTFIIIINIKNIFFFHEVFNRTAFIKYLLSLLINLMHPC